MNLATEQSDELDCAISRVAWAEKNLSDAKREFKEATHALDSARRTLSRATSDVERTETEYITAKEHLRAIAARDVTVTVRGNHERK